MRNRTENKIKLFLIRHGETPGNKERRYIGTTDEALSEEGIRWLWVLKERDRYPEISFLFSSPMKRCIQTAELLYPALKPMPIPEWAEMDFGDFERKNYQELKEDERYQWWIDSNGLLPFPGGESREEFINRCKNGMERLGAYMEKDILKNRIPGDEVTVGAVVHGGTIMAVLSSYYGGEYFDYQVVNGGGYQCELVLGTDGLRIEKIEGL